MTNKGEREGKMGEAENNKAAKKKQRSEGKRKDVSP